MAGKPQALRPTSYLVRAEDAHVMITLQGLGAAGAGARTFALDVETAHHFQGLVAQAARAEDRRTLDEAVALFGRPEPHPSTPFVIAWGAVPFSEPSEIGDARRVVAQLTAQDRPGFLSRVFGGGKLLSGEPCVFVLPGDGERFAKTVLRAAVIAQQWIEAQERPKSEREEDEVTP